MYVLIDYLCSTQSKLNTMNYEKAEQTLIDHIKSSDNYIEDFKGFDFGDESFNGYYTTEVELENEEILFFEGTIYFSISEDSIDVVTIERIIAFGHYDCEGDLIKKFN